MEIMVSARASRVHVELVSEWNSGLELIGSRREKSSCICLQSKHDPSDV